MLLMLASTLSYPTYSVVFGYMQGSQNQRDKKHNVRVDYDICFMANATQAHIERQALFLKAMAATRYRVLALVFEDARQRLVGG